MKGRHITGLLSGLAASIILTCSVFAMSDEELKEESLALWQNLAESAVSGDYDSFRALYKDTDEEAIQGDYSYDFNLDLGMDQRYAIIIARSEPYYYVQILSAMCAGTFPNTQYQDSWYNLVMEETVDGLRITYNEEVINRLTEYANDAIYPEDMLDALSCGRNCTEMNVPYLHCDPGCVISGAFFENLAFAWQDEEGNLMLGLMSANGSGGNRAYNSINIELTDDNLGTIYSGDVIGKSVDGNCMIANNTNKILYFKIPYNEVQTGTSQWGSMHCSFNNNWT